MNRQTVQCLTAFSQLTERTFPLSFRFRQHLAESNIWLLPHEATQRTLSIWPTDISGNWSCAHLMTCFPSPCSDRSTRENTNRTNRSDLLLNILQLLWTNWEKHWWLQTIKLKKINPKASDRRHSLSHGRHQGEQNTTTSAVLRKRK